MQTGQFELAVTIPRDGRSHRLREYGHGGLTYVEGRPGQAFAIQIRNNTPDRVLAVLSVDGLDVVDGRPATELSRGYVLEGYSSTEVLGWRTSLESIRKFFFEKKDGSYAAATAGGTANCGIIAAKMIREKVRRPEVKHVHHHHHHHHPRPRPWPYVYPWSQPIWTSGSTGDMAEYSCDLTPGTSGETLSIKSFHVEQPVYGSVAPSNTVTASAAQAAFNLGAGWGAEAQSQVREVVFQRGPELATLAIYYTDATGLEGAGISLVKETAIASALPQAFSPFCQPPAKSPG